MMHAQKFIQTITDYFTHIMKKILLIICITQFLLLGCSLHKLDVQQGNVITPDVLAKLKLGMTQEQVKFLLGTPPITDPFHATRWDYTYTYREQDKQTETSHLTLLFNETELLIDINQSAYLPPKERSGKAK